MHAKKWISSLKVKMLVLISLILVKNINIVLKNLEENNSFSI